VSVFLVACGEPPSADGESGKPEVITTVGMIADVARNVAGDCAIVTPLMGPGTDPHAYRASARDSRTLGSADLILYSGYALEGEFGDLLERIGERRPTLAVAEAAIPRAETLATDDQYGVDPHIWMDVRLWARTAEVIAGRLGELMPECAARMQANARGYRARLETLDGWVRRSIATIPLEQRVLVTAHDAFVYYARTYGLEVAGIQGISTASEAAIGDIRSTVRTVVERNVPAIFVESSVNARTVRAVQQAAAAAAGFTGLGRALEPHTVI
jgi:manganese/zinc/iron transport system substrate-binding protein